MSQMKSKRRNKMDMHVQQYNTIHMNKNMKRYMKKVKSKYINTNYHKLMYCNDCGYDMDWGCICYDDDEDPYGVHDPTQDDEKNDTLCYELELICKTISNGNNKGGNDLIINLDAMLRYYIQQNVTSIPMQYSDDNRLLSVIDRNGCGINEVITIINIGLTLSVALNLPVEVIANILKKLSYIDKRFAFIRQ